MMNQMLPDGTAHAAVRALATAADHAVVELLKVTRNDGLTHQVGSPAAADQVRRLLPGGGPVGVGYWPQWPLAPLLLDDGRIPARHQWREAAAGSRIPEPCSFVQFRGLIRKRTRVGEL